jgi:hypothetical protein
MKSKALGIAMNSLLSATGLGDDHGQGKPGRPSHANAPVCLSSSLFRSIPPQRLEPAENRRTRAVVSEVFRSLSHHCPREHEQGEMTSDPYIYEWMRKKKTEWHPRGSDALKEAES